MVSGPLSELHFQYLDGHDWELTKDFYWLFRDGIILKMDKDFVCDMHSVPKPLQLIIPKTEYGRAAVIHDWLYRKNGIVHVICADKTRLVYWNRKKCDKLYLEALEVLEAPYIKRRMMYRGVRLGGWYAWHTNKTKNS